LHRAVVGLDLVPALAAEGVVEAGELLVAHPQGERGLAWKPMLMRWGMVSVSLRGLDDLREHAAGRLGVQEGDARAADAGARRSSMSRRPRSRRVSSVACTSATW
jgi:hypothetical protein